MAAMIERGQFVCAADGEALGNVAYVDEDSFLVDDGSPSSGPLECRLIDVADVRNGGIRLSRSRAQLHRAHPSGAAGRSTPGGREGR